MATAYTATRSNAAAAHQVFSGGADAVVISATDTDPGKVVAVVSDLTTAQQIATALNGA